MRTSDVVEIASSRHDRIDLLIRIMCAISKSRMHLGHNNYGGLHIQRTITKTLNLIAVYFSAIALITIRSSDHHRSKSKDLIYTSVCVCVCSKMCPVLSPVCCGSLHRMPGYQLSNMVFILFLNVPLIMQLAVVIVLFGSYFDFLTFFFALCLSLRFEIPPVVVGRGEPAATFLCILCHCFSVPLFSTYSTRWFRVKMLSLHRKMTNEHYLIMLQRRFLRLALLRANTFIFIVHNVHAVCLLLLPFLLCSVVFVFCAAEASVSSVHFCRVCACVICRLVMRTQCAPAPTVSYLRISCSRVNVLFLVGIRAPRLSFALSATSTFYHHFHTSGQTIFVTHACSCCARLQTRTVGRFVG